MKIIKIDDNSYIEEYTDGTKEWYQNDLLHRLDGPAIEWCNGNKCWYYENQRIECSSQEEFERIIKERNEINEVNYPTLKGGACS